MALTDNIVAYWKLDESSGDAIDATGNGFTLTNTNTVTYSVGVIDNGANFVAASSQFLIDNSTNNYVDGAIAMSLSFWLNQTNIADYKPIAQWNGLFSNSDFLVEIDTSGRIGLVVTDSIGVNSSSRRISGSITTGVWQHWVLTWTATDTVIIYKNGVSQTLQAWLGGSGVSAIGTNLRQKLTIGKALDGGFLNGSMDEVGIWNRTLTQNEVNLLYNGGFGVQYPFNNFFSIVLV